MNSESSENLCITKQEIHEIFEIYNMNLLTHKYSKTNLMRISLLKTVSLYKCSDNINIFKPSAKDHETRFEKFPTNLTKSAKEDILNEIRNRLLQLTTLRQTGNHEITKEEVSNLIKEFGNGIRAKLFFKTYFRRNCKTQKLTIEQKNTNLSKAKLLFIEKNEMNKGMTLMGDVKQVSEEEKISSKGMCCYLSSEVREKFIKYFDQIFFIMVTTGIINYSDKELYDYYQKYNIKEYKKWNANKVHIYPQIWMMFEKAIYFYSLMTPLEEWKVHYEFTIDKKCKFIRNRFPKQFKKPVFSYLFVLILKLFNNIRYNPKERN